MNILYADAALVGDLGHHANYCRHIVGGLRARSMTVRVYGYTGISAALARELRAQALFRCNTYRTYASVPSERQDRLVTWLHHFETAVNITTADFASMLAG